MSPSFDVKRKIVLNLFFIVFFIILVFVIIHNFIKFSEMFLFYLVAAAELLGVMKLHEFVEFYSPNEVRNIIQTLEPGSWLTRPSLEQAGLRGMARAEAVSGVANNNGVKPESEKEKPRKRKENPRDVFLGDTDETDSDEEFEVERKKTLRRALFNEGPGLAKKIWARFNIAEKDHLLRTVIGKE